MSQDMEIKREREKRMVSQMILLYCRKNHNTPGGLCPQCRKLDDYARARSEHCPFMETKTFCSNCRVHCYRSEMREEIRKVMRFSGPRMIFLSSGGGDTPCDRDTERAAVAGRRGLK